MKLYEKIIKLRKEKGLSQEEFGNAINVSRQAVSKWESEQTKPDIDKLKDIAKFFDVSYEYLLNDEIDNIEDVPKETIKKTNARKIIIRILIVFVAIYLLFSVYKFIALFRIYKVADSFSEENYWMSKTFTTNGEDVMDHSTQKVGDRIIITTSNPYAPEEHLITNENGEVIPYDIEFIDTKTKEWYTLHYDNETKTYRYEGHGIRNVDTEEDLNKILNGERNYLKELTLDHIPSNVKDILVASLNPVYQVSIARNEIYVNNFNRFKIRIQFTKDCLIQHYVMETEFDGTVAFTASYDYVQDHFDKEITPPLEAYKDKIVNLEDVK